MERLDTIPRGWKRRAGRAWTRFWVRRAGYHGFGRLAARLALWFAPPHLQRAGLARLTPQGFIAPGVHIYHRELLLGDHVFLDERVVILQRRGGAGVHLDDGVTVYRDCVLETGEGGSIHLGREASLHPGVQVKAYLQPVRIGSGVMIAANCALYAYDHALDPDAPIRSQPLRSKGPIIIGDEVWLGTGAIVLGGVTIGEGAVIGAGAVVTRDVPAGAIAVGNPAKVVKMRRDLVRLD